MTRPDRDGGRFRLRDKKAPPSPPLDETERQTAFVWEGKDLKGREDRED